MAAGSHDVLAACRRVTAAVSSAVCASAGWVDGAARQQHVVQCKAALHSASRMPTATCSTRAAGGVATYCCAAACLCASGPLQAVVSMVRGRVARVAQGAARPGLG